jgi:hypothetical protein
LERSHNMEGLSGQLALRQKEAGEKNYSSDMEA